MKEAEILQVAIQRLNTLTGGIATFHRNKVTVNDNGIDGFADFRTGHGKIRFNIQVRNEIRKMHLPEIIHKMRPNLPEWLLVCQYIPEPLKEELRKQGINYLEAAGNCWIRKDDLYIFSNDKEVTPFRLPKEGKLWKQAGLKYLFAVLQETNLINAPYREQVKVTRIALGTIGPLIEELKQEGYAKTGKKEGKECLFLENKEALRNKWLELFDAALKPKLRRGKYRFFQLPVDRAELLRKKWKGTYWGGEAAGAILTGHLRPENYTLYTALPEALVMKELRLVPDSNGEIELMEVFWNEDFYNDKYNPATVPPLLAYAELITSLDSRNRETAERIKEKYLDQPE